MPSSGITVLLDNCFYGARLLALHTEHVCWHVSAAACEICNFYLFVNMEFLNMMFRRY